MNIYKDINEKIAENCVVSIGFFDGVHLGHKYLIDQLIEISKKNDLPSMIITMWPHPVKVLKKTNIKLLNTLNEKIEILRNLGINNLLILDFNENLASISTKDFVESLLISKLKIKIIIKGFNNSFGKNKDFDSNLMNNKKIKIIKADEYLLSNDILINSTKIRESLSKGDIIFSNKLLGYNYSIKGTVKQAYKIGRKIGFPTANLSDIDENKLIPSNGAYIIKAKIDNNWFPAMLNIGNRPTFGGSKKTLEFHILNYNHKIYNKEVEIRFYQKLRDEKKFDNVHFLIEQLNKDKRTTKLFFDKKCGIKKYNI